MANYIIGDIHGQYEALLRLIDEIEFDRTHDTLYFVGDLINGGKQNVEVIEFIIELGDSAKAILGNHDLSTIAAYFGTRRRSSKSTTGDLIDHPRADEIFDWLRTLRLVHTLEDGSVIVHAGIPAGWDASDAEKYSRKVEKRLQKDDPTSFLKRMFEPAPLLWRHCDSKSEKLVYTVNALTRMRAVTRTGALDFDFKSVLSDLPGKLEPWFRFRRRFYTPGKNSEKKVKLKKMTGELDPIPNIYFGHWSALGFYQEGNVTCLDSGVRWGGPLTAIRTDDQQVFQVQLSSGKSSVLRYFETDSA